MLEKLIESELKRRATS
ncbi:hypothetical protein IHV63_28620 [Escherichia coli]|nr:hypothetical protein [Escherichia coli]